MARYTETGRFDPLPAFRFFLQLGGVTVGSFTEVTGLSLETEAIDYREGGESTIMRQVPGLTRSGDITLKRGLSADSSLFFWASQVGAINGVTTILPDPLFRRTLTLMVHDRGGIAVKSFMIVRAWPKKYAPGDFKSMANEIAIEEVVLGNEGFSEVPAGGFAFSTPSLV